MHVVLLGDSIIDNKAYVEQDEPDVATQLSALLGDEHKVTSCAIDGSMTSDIATQLDNVPSDATHIVISMGGNDLINVISYAEYPVDSTMEAMIVLSNLSYEFRQNYRRVSAASIFEPSFV